MINVLYFGVLRETLGAQGGPVVVEDGATVRDVVAKVRDARAGGMWEVLAVAVNREYAGLETVLQEGDEVALLPPVSGGAGAR